MGIDCYRVLFPKGMDANEYAAKVKPAARSLAVLLNKAQWLGKGKPPVITVSNPVEVEPQIDNAPAAKEENTDSSSLAAESADPKSAAAAMPPDSPVADMPVTIDGDEITMVRGDRRYRIRGLGKNLSHEVLKVNVLVSRGERFYVDTLDLYSARQRAAFTKPAAEELEIEDEEVLRRDLGRVLLKLEKLQDEQIRKALKPKETRVEIPQEEKAAAFRLLKDPKLFDRILEDFARCGVVGEETNKLTGYLAAVSRRLEAPLAVVVQSSSAAGKSLADGCDPLICAGRRAGAVLGHDGPVALLYGRDGSQAQGARHCGGGRRNKGRVRAEAAAERRRAHDRLHGQGSVDGKACDAPVPRARPGDDLPDDDGNPSRRGAIEPLPGADRQ